MAEIAKAIGEATWQELVFVDVSSEDFTHALQNAGVPRWQADGLWEDYAHYARGEAAGIQDTVREITGRAPREVTEFARDHADAFKSHST
ncbi:hypothetical protein [Thiohalorhabdus methylotrophus]|uniref:NmrA family protein n=1 Tax=Thiohalorhabdus methylotrophus TaxID=3242694 RepID=A0ABV4TXI2_9GAMM